MLNLYVIGCGGIGGYLVDLLPMTIASVSLDAAQKSGKFNITDLLEKAGNVALPCIVDRLVLVDGDTFNARNAVRQGMGAGSKLVQRMRAIDSSVLRRGYLQNMHMHGFNTYINPGNMAGIIPKNPPVNPDNVLAAPLGSTMVGIDSNTTVVFLCVDNMKTRYEVSKYMELFDNCLVINGGNEKTTGHVTLYERHNSMALDPNIYDVYPNVTADADQRPDEIACTFIEPQHDQVAVTNNIVATVMLACFSKWVRQGLEQEEGRGDKRRMVRKNEVLIDTDKMTMMTLHHPVATSIQQA